MTPVLVTGATGFIGGRIVEMLRERGEEVRALARPTSDTSRLRPLGVEIAYGDVTDGDSLRQAMVGCQRLYHVAAIVRPPGVRPRHYRQINVEGTRNVLAAALEAGVERVVHTSSVAALGAAGGIVIQEDTPPRSGLGDSYSRSKAQAEEVAREFLARGLDVVMVNPSIVFGPWDRTFVRLLRAYLRSPLPVLAHPESTMGLVYVDDVARGHMLAMERGRRGERYILSAENVTVRRLFTLVAEAAGRSPPRLVLPFWLLRLGVTATAPLFRALGREPLATPGGLRVLEEGGARFDNRRSRKELGLAYTPVAEALATTLAWMART